MPSISLTTSRCRAEMIVTPVVCWDGSEGDAETQVIELLGMFICPYEARYYYWELVDMARKLLLTAVLVNFVDSTSTAYVTVAFALSFVALVLHTLCKPYVSMRLDELQTGD